MLSVVLAVVLQMLGCFQNVFRISFVLVVCVRCQLCSESFDVLRMSFCSSCCLCVVSVVLKCAFDFFFNATLFIYILLFWLFVQCLIFVYIQIYVQEDTKG